MSARSDYRNRVADMVTELRARSDRHAPTAAADTSSGLTVRNVAGETAVIRIYDEISYWGITALDVIDELDQITSTPSMPPWYRLRRPSRSAPAWS